MEPPPPPFEHRLDRTQHVAKRMQDTLTSRVCRVFCSIFLSLSLIAAILVFIVWLSLRPHRPRFHLADFSAAGLSDNRTAAVFSFHVLLRNPNQKIGIFYDDAMRGQLFYHDDSVGTARPLLPPFYQRPKNTTDIRGELPEPGLAVDQALLTRIRADLAATGEVWFRLRLEAAIRFRVKTWDTHQHDMKVDCDAGVRPDGSILPAAKGRRCPIYFF
ncbi:unnamed protein product [Spirodela intermedia]|uniref:Late embryogenesis abundant protein LEA-2 subgroup domain-containing protein n=1 Tax=Spirodela intermedia TaxID=51605 RepID=A0A7I8LGV5_SPIIN|nr:unnamed protein product [Spirodela intermedia]